MCLLVPRQENHRMENFHLTLKDRKWLALERQQVEEERAEDICRKPSTPQTLLLQLHALLREGVPGWPHCSRPFIHFPNTHPSFLLPASSDTAINIPPAFHRSREMHIADERELRWQYETAFRPALVKCAIAGSSALNFPGKMESFKSETVSLFIILTSGLGYMGLFLSKKFPPINNILHMAQS